MTAERRGIERDREGGERERERERPLPFAGIQDRCCLIAFVVCLGVTELLPRS
jgi:hypothetical protein